MKKAQEELNRKREAGELIRLSPIEKALKNPTSLRAAINAKCWDCTCEQISEIRFCTAFDCPLHGVRPYQTKEP